MHHHVRENAETLDDEGKQVAHIMEFPGSIAAFVPLMRNENELERVSRFQSVALLPAHWDRKTTMNVVVDDVHANPDIKCLSASEDNVALGVIQTLKTAGKLGDMYVTGSRGITDVATVIRNDEVAASTVPTHYENGFNMIEDKTANSACHYCGMAKLTN